MLADKVYGGRDSLRLGELVPTPPGRDEVLIARQALHAHRIRFRHPCKNEWVEGEAPLHPDMLRVLAALRG